MGRRRKNPKHKPTKKWYQTEDDWGNYVFDWSLGLSPQVWREIFSVLVIIIAVVVFLGLLNSAGALGEVLSVISKKAFGKFGSFVFIISFLYFGVLLLVPPKHGYKVARFLGLLFLIVALPTFIHLFVPQDLSLETAKLGGGGGMIGYLITQILVKSIGIFPAFLVSVAFLFIALSMIFEFSIIGFLGFGSKDREDEEGKGISVNKEGNRISVFEAVRRKLSSLRSEKRPVEILDSKAEVIEVSPEQRAKRDNAWEFPPLSILKDSSEEADPGNIYKNADLIQKCLKNFGIDIAMGEVNIGPTVTQYTLKPNEGVKLNQIVARQTDLALALSAKSIRIEAPIPGKSSVGIEMPNKITAKVTLKEVITSGHFKSVKSRLAMPLGRDVSGDPVAIDLEKMPHLLIAGATGSGKSVCINAVIVSLLFNNSPDDLRLLLVDPKRVELTGYNGIPHLLTPVVTEVDKTVSALKWAVWEMERRYRMFEETGKRNIQAYNAAPGPEGSLPFIVIIIDELADLMATSAKEVEASIVRLAQMARATGIHLIIATQRPSVNVLTGLIKANITARIAFATASQIDSRTIIDVSGSEKLLGNGDMLFLGNGVSKPKRVQGCFVSDSEIEELNEFLKNKGIAEYDESITSFKAGGGGGGSYSVAGSDEDDLYDEAVETIVRAGKASASLLQRRLKVGYARAARLLDILEENGIIGPADGAKPRDVLITDIGPSQSFGGPVGENEREDY